MAGDEGTTVAEHIGAKQVNRPAVARESETRMLNAATTLFSWGRHEDIEAAPTRIPPLHQAYTRRYLVTPEPQILGSCFLSRSADFLRVTR